VTVGEVATGMSEEGGTGTRQDRHVKYVREDSGRILKYLRYASVTDRAQGEVVKAKIARAAC
jgi:hypothetical protein